MLQNGIECYLNIISESDGLTERAKEYPCRASEDLNLSSAYVIAQTEKSICVNVDFSDRKEKRGSYIVTIVGDGKTIRRYYTRREYTYVSECEKRLPHGCFAYGSMKFARLMIVDEVPKGEACLRHPQNIGSLAVIIHRAEKSRKDEAVSTLVEIELKEVAKPEIIKEENLTMVKRSSIPADKLLSHKIYCPEYKKKKRFKTMDMRSGEHLATFKFQYMSKEILQKERIVSGIPSALAKRSVLKLPADLKPLPQSISSVVMQPQAIGPTTPNPNAQPSTNTHSLDSPPTSVIKTEPFPLLPTTAVEMRAYLKGLELVENSYETPLEKMTDAELKAYHRGVQTAMANMEARVFKRTLHELEDSEAPFTRNQRPKLS